MCLLLQKQNIAAEEKLLIEENKMATKEQRERIAEETDRLLQEQDKRIGLLIARLQVRLTGTGSHIRIVNKIYM